MHCHNRNNLGNNFISLKQSVNKNDTNQKKTYYCTPIRTKNNLTSIPKIVDTATSLSNLLRKLEKLISISILIFLTSPPFKVIITHWLIALSE